MRASASVRDNLRVALRLTWWGAIAWSATACSVLFDDDPCAGAEPSALGYTFMSRNVCDGDVVMSTHQCFVEGEPSLMSYSTFERDCAASGAQCLSGVCVSRTEVCPEGHGSFCDVDGARGCVGSAVMVGAHLCDASQRCIEVEEAGEIRAQCALSDVPCTHERSMCDGDTRVSCQQGFPVEREACEGFASRCVETQAGDAVCISSECEPGETRDICVGGVIVACSEYASHVLTDCSGRGVQCVTEGSAAFCSATGELTQRSWVKVPGGSFTFRTNGGEPEQALLPDFEIMTTEVTWAQYRACVEDGACTLTDGCFEVDGNLPIHCAFGAEAFCTWAGGRLPVETEWQYVATNRGTTTFPWGDAPPSCSLAAVGALGTSAQGCTDAPVEVCSATGDRTALGVCDMAGNVREFVVRPGFPESPYSVGGSFAIPAAQVSLLPSEPRIFDQYPYVDIGFRCVR